MTSCSAADPAPAFNIMNTASQTGPARSPAPRAREIAPRELLDELKSFHEFNGVTRTDFIDTGSGRRVPVLINEFWTSRQRAAHSLHEISYRACFKPQLPRFFIERLTRPGDVVYDPFMGRGTTPLEAALRGRVPFGNDINPLSLAFTRPRFRPPTVEQVVERLGQIDFADHDEFPEELMVFYHPETLREICALKKWFLQAGAIQPRPGRDSPGSHPADEWLGMVALNRLTGHSPGFFSVYTLPPNQAVSVESQRKINQKRNQIPPRRDVARLLLKKSRQLLDDVTPDVRRTLAGVADRMMFTARAADRTREIPDESVALIVTSPPFLDVVDYATDNWLRCWFLGIDPQAVKLTVPRKLEAWADAMTSVFAELQRVLRPGGYVAFEVGEVHRGKTKLEEAVLPCGAAAGLEPILVLINDQRFTKTANCWGVRNNTLGTNTNRIVLFRKSGVVEKQLSLALLPGFKSAAGKKKSSSSKLTGRRGPRISWSFRHAGA